MKKTIVVIAVVFISFISFGQKDTLIKTAQSKSQIDTLPPQFALVGTLPDFQLLLAAILSPDDVSVNQRKALDAWIRKIQALPKPKN